jgi:hypothetical protein
MKIKFHETRTVEAQGKIVDVFEAGKVYELPLTSAQRWLRRNVASQVIGKPKPAAKPKPKPVVKEKVAAASDDTKSKTAAKPEPAKTGTESDVLDDPAKPSK